MIYRIKVEGKEYNENYTFETPKEGDILDELKAIVEDMKEGNINKLEVEREAQEYEKKVFTPDGTFLGRALKIKTTGNGVEITMLGDFPGMVERIITYPGGSIVYEDENRIYIKY